MEENLKQPKKKSHIKILIGLLSILIIIGIAYFSSPNLFKTSSSSSSKNFIFKSVQDKTFTIKAYKNHIKIAELKGKIIFLKVFGWNCKYCQKEIPELIKLKNKFKNSFDTLAIEAQHHSSIENMEFIKKYHINYTILDGDKQKAFLDYLKKEYGWDGVIPLTIIIDGNGKILAFEAGYKSYSLTTLLQTTLKELTMVAVESEKGGN
jgi:peroxiredoxin